MSNPCVSGRRQIHRRSLTNYTAKVLPGGPRWLQVVAPLPNAHIRALLLSLTHTLTHIHSHTRASEYASVGEPYPRIHLRAGLPTAQEAACTRRNHDGIGMW